MNQSASAKRKLTAIMFTDIVGYTAMMSKDERKTLQTLEKSRQITKPLIEKYNGEWLKEMGDGALSIFQSPVDAVNCAIEIQAALKDDVVLNLRIGIHIGDVIFENNDVFGDGVNVASRIEPLASSGGICISERVYDDIRNKPDINAVFIGEKELKNVDRPIKVYALTGEGISPPASASFKDKGRKKSSKTPLISIVAIVGFLMVAYFVFFNNFHIKESEPIKTIAVLPFENTSGDPDQEYFVDGMTDILTNFLQKIGSLQVISRTSVMLYKGAHKPLPQIAKELGVQAVVEGSVLLAGDRVRITAQLVQAATDHNLWADNYERDLIDVLTLQSDVAQTIVSAIKIKLTPTEEISLKRVGVVNPDAQKAYLKGRYFWNSMTKTSLLKSIDYYQQAINIDSLFSPAYAGLAESYFALGDVGIEAIPPGEGMEKAKPALQKALELDDHLAEAHAALGIVSMEYDWDRGAAERELKRSLELNPNYAQAYIWYSQYLNTIDDHEGALKAILKAKELDPFSPFIDGNIGFRYLIMGNYDKGLEILKKGLELNPNHWYTHWSLATIYNAMGMYDKAINTLKEAARLSEGNTTVLSLLGQIYGISGKTEEAQTVINQLNELSQDHFISPCAFAQIYTGLGDNNSAFEWLEKAYEQKSGWMIWLKITPEFRSLNSDPRFAELIKRIDY